MNILDLDMPFRIQLSFAAILDRLYSIAQGSDSDQARSAQTLLDELAPFPEFREGITSIKQVQEHADLIRRLLENYFPPELTYNEIKAVSIPLLPIIFNHTERFKHILAAAGPDFEMGIRDFDAHQFYVLSCCIILNDVYGTKLDFSKPLFYDIPTAQGIIRHYRILYNADFLDIIPTEQALQLSQADIEELLDNYDNLDLWKAKFPPNSWLMKGFALMVLYDATTENAVSLLKEKLLGSYQIDFHENLLPIFQSIFNSKSLQIGFTMYNAANDTFTKAAFGEPLPSFILSGHDSCEARQTLCEKSYQKIVNEHIYFAVADTREYAVHSLLIEHLNQQQIRSFILAPVVKNQQLWGVLEVVSSRPREFNSINAHKLEVLMPFLTETIDRMEAELQNHIQAFIQNVYTTIHPSVYWKFRQEALAYLYHQQAGQPHTLAEIAFPDVHPLYGQVDVKGSSEARNLSTQKDLQTQLEILQRVLDQVGMETFEKQQVAHFLIDISQPLQASTEPYITAYLDHRIHPHLRTLNDPSIDDYFRETALDTGRFYHHRRKYDRAIQQINDNLTRTIDQRQQEAQAIFPHYYERFRTDGVEHNLYIGASIAPTLGFRTEHLRKLRLWQLRVVCEMEASHQQLRPVLPYPFDVTTLILVFPSTITIAFRLDEKRFDVQGTYNARFEIVKKRIDKAHVKGTQERITQSGKLCVVYSGEEEEAEYDQYLTQLQKEGLLDSTIEKLDVEDLQGVAGLKVLRVGITVPRGKDFASIPVESGRITKEPTPN